MWGGGAGGRGGGGGGHIYELKKSFVLGCVQLVVKSCAPFHTTGFRRFK